MTNTLFFSGNLLHNTMNSRLHLHRFHFFPHIFSRTTVYSRLFKCLPWFPRHCLWMRACSSACLCALPSFIFNFSVYPETSLQSVDKELAMTARANMAELLERLTEKKWNWWLSTLNSLEKGRILYVETVWLSALLSLLTYQLNPTICHVGVRFSPIIT